MMHVKKLFGAKLASEAVLLYIFVLQALTEYLNCANI